jgi:hypothetical protein
MKRYTIMLTEEAEKIYKGVPLFERSKWVSEAIICKSNAVNCYDKKTEEIERRLRELESRQ